MKRTTAALRRRIDVAEARSVATPLFQSAAFHADSPYFYSRKDNPNVAELESAVALLEGAKHGVAASTGMAAISLATSVLKAGDVLVVHPLLYGCSFRQMQRLAKQRGVIVEVRDLAAKSLSLAPGTRMVFFETPTNPFLRSVDIRRVAIAAKRANRDALVVVDNTWATPLFQKPLEHGADLSIHSATKFISGHGDVMGGLVLTDRDDLRDLLREERFYAGAVMDPHAAWLLRRSLQTLPLRMKAHAETTVRMAKFLESQPAVARVDLPSIDGHQLTGYGGILFFELREDRYLEFRDALSLFDTGTGMACVTSTVAQPWSGSHASMTDAEKKAIGLSTRLVRLCFGMEDEDDLREDLAKAFAAVAVRRRKVAR